MRLRWKRYFWCPVLVVLLVVAFSGCENSDRAVVQQAESMPTDFNFTLKFGYAGKNVIDTYQGTFTKDLIINGTETIPFVIPEEKMKEIYASFVANSIIDLPGDINTAAEIPIEAITVWTTPADSYSLIYTCKGVTQTILCEDGGPWDADTGPPEVYHRLKGFISFVREYIYSTEDYQNMSPAEGGYD